MDCKLSLPSLKIKAKGFIYVQPINRNERTSKTTLEVKAGIGTDDLKEIHIMIDIRQAACLTLRSMKKTSITKIIISLARTCPVFWMDCKYLVKESELSAVEYVSWSVNLTPAIRFYDV